MHRRDDFHYSVLFTRVEKQERLLNIISEFLPKERGFAFVPMKEYYRRSWRDVTTKALFPGYVFICSDMTRTELHEFLVKYRTRIDAFVSQLGIGADLRAGEDPYAASVRKKREEAFSEDTADLEESKGEDSEGADFEQNEEESNHTGDSYSEIADLTPEETAYLDMMLDDDGIQRMSEGYVKDGWAVVVNGPLVGQEDKIFRVDKHERIAYLTVKFRGIRMSSGLELKPQSSFG